MRMHALGSTAGLSLATLRRALLIEFLERLPVVVSA
jgi:hypothetical protein